MKGVSCRNFRILKIDLRKIWYVVAIHVILAEFNVKFPIVKNGLTMGTLREHNSAKKRLERGIIRLIMAWHYYGKVCRRAFSDACLAHGIIRPPAASALPLRWSSFARPASTVWRKTKIKNQMSRIDI